MLGSILSNLLLVMGMCFLLGGIFNMRDSSGAGTEQRFASGTAQTTCSLLALSSASMILPAVLYGVLNSADDDEKEKSILFLSRGTAIILLLLYVLFLCTFLLLTPSLQYSTSFAPGMLPGDTQNAALAQSLTEGNLDFQLHTHKNMFDPERDATESAESGSTTEDGRHEEEEDSGLGTWAGAAVLIVVTVIISFCADYLVGSIDDIVATGAVSKTFIGLILIPIVGNAAEHVTACVVAVKNNMDLAMGVAIGSSIQIALLVTPFLVILGWIIGQPMTLRFETCESPFYGCEEARLTAPSRNGCVRSLGVGCYLHSAGWKIQLSRRCNGE